MNKPAHGRRRHGHLGFTLCGVPTKKDSFKHTKGGRRVFVLKELNRNLITCRRCRGTQVFAMYCRVWDKGYSDVGKDHTANG